MTEAPVVIDEELGRLEKLLLALSGSIIITDHGFGVTAREVAILTREIVY